MVQRIALLGFAERCSFRNGVIAHRIGRALGVRGVTLVCGNNRETFYHAMRGASSAFRSFRCQEIVTSDLLPSALTDSPILASSSLEKHRLISNYADAAIVVGGGRQTLKLVDRFLSGGKKVAVVINTGGVVRWELPSWIPRYRSETDAVNFLCGGSR